jgi:hypothetical protein
VRRVARRALALGVVATLVLLGAGCRKQVPVGQEGRLEPSGNVLLTGRGGDPVSLRSPRTLRAGDVVEVSDGTANVSLPNGASLELRPRAVVSFDRGPEVRTGEVLVMARPGPQVVRSAGSEVSFDGVGRLTQTLALRVATYNGTATVRSGGTAIDVPPLRQVALPAVGVVPGAPSPMELGTDDIWDRRFLGDVLDAMDDLEARAKGFTAQTLLMKEGRSVGFYRQIIPALDPEPAFQESYVKQLNDPGEVLLATSIAVQGRRGTFAERLDGARAFRADGAPWALVAKDQEVPSLDALARNVDGTINEAALKFPPTPPPTVPTAQVTPTSAPPRPRDPSTPTSQPPTTSPSEPPTTGPSQPPSTTPPQQPPPVETPTDPNPGLLNGVVDPVVTLLDGLLGGG